MTPAGVRTALRIQVYFGDFLVHGLSAQKEEGGGGFEPKISPRDILTAL